MDVKILASGSSGNCIWIGSGGASVLIDAGLPKTKIERRMLDAGVDPTTINAIFVTHAHGDHIKGLPLANKYRIPVYASEGEWKRIDSVDSELQRNIKPGDFVRFDFYGSGWPEIWPFKTHHDARDPLGYTIQGKGEKVSVCLDTGKVDRDMLNAMYGSDIYIIESNHDPDMVVASSYPISVQTRVLSDLGHLSNDQCAAALQRLIRGVGERIYLTHLSSNNNMPALAEATVKRALRQRGFTAGEHYHLEVV